MSPSSHSPTRRVALIHVGLIVVACLVTFGPILANGFVSWDDYQTLSQNPRMSAPSFEGLLYYWQHPYMHLYAPLTYTVWMSLAALGLSIEVASSRTITSGAARMTRASATCWTSAGVRA